MSNWFFSFFPFAILLVGEKMEDIKLNELITVNQNLIYSIIHRFRSRDVEDLFQVGCVGLIKAYQKYDYSMNVKFTSYAYNFIVGEIYQYIINNRNIRMSPANIKLYHAINRARESLTSYLNRSPTIDELCSLLEIEPYKYEEIQSAMIPVNIDSIYDLSDKSTISKDQLIDLRDAVSGLTEEERQIIKARYFNNYTQSELARMYNTNQVKISREEKRILSKLKAKMH